MKVSPQRIFVLFLFPSVFLISFLFFSFSLTIAAVYPLV